MKIQLVALLIFGFWSFFAMAQDPANQLTMEGLTVQNVTKDVQVINAWTKHLNSNYADLNLRPKLNDLSKTPIVISQLGELENVLHGDYQLPSGSLGLLDCRRCVCDGCAQAKK